MTEIENYFVCVGAQKAGTTWLSNLLSEHPDIFVTPVKEIHYFDHVQGLTHKLSPYKRWSRFRKHLQNNLLSFNGTKHYQMRWFRNYLRGPISDEWYASLFQCPKGQKVQGEFTPEYAMIGPTGFEHLKRLAPTAKILFVLRHPIEQAWSQYLHFHDRTAGQEIDRDEAIRFWKSDYSKRLRDYPGTIKQLYQSFGHDHIHLTFYESLKNDTENTLNSIFGFLEVGKYNVPEKKIRSVYNKSRDIGIDSKLKSYLESECHNIVADVTEIIGHVPKSWKE